MDEHAGCMAKIQRQTGALRIFIFRNSFAVWLAVKLRLKEENIIILGLWKNRLLEYELDSIGL